MAVAQNLPRAWKKITAMRFYRAKHCKIGHGSYALELECGHTARKKQSECKNKSVGSRINCWQCQTAVK